MVSMDSAFFLDRGRVNIEYGRVELAPDVVTHEIERVIWEGAPFAVIGWWDIDRLPSWAKVGDNLAQIGPYVVQRTNDYDAARAGYYWVIVGKGEWHWVYWRVMRVLQWVWWRLLLTLAVWGLAEWPTDAQPSWGHVVARWRNWWSKLQRKECAQ
jgi:hypothetical protein